MSNATLAPHSPALSSLILLGQDACELSLIPYWLTGNWPGVILRLPVELTLNQKFDVANLEADHAKSQMEECKNVSEKLIDDLRVLTPPPSVFLPPSPELLGACKPTTTRLIGDVGRGGPLLHIVRACSSPSNGGMAQSRACVELVCTETRQALLEEADIKLSEISKDAYEFKRDVGSSVPGKPVSEKVLHFLEDKLRTTDSVVDKLTLKNAALKQQILKLENQLQVGTDPNP